MITKTCECGDFYSKKGLEEARKRVKEMLR